MKLFRIGLLLFSALFFNSCIGEDLDSCPEIVGNNLTIEFLYTDKDNNHKDIFPDKINQVDLFVFNDKGHYVTTRSVDQASLSVFAGTQLQLDPGTYRLVMWANAADRCTFGKVNSGHIFQDAFLGNATIDENSVAVNGDKLYYAPDTRPTSFASEQTPQEGLILTVPEKGTASTSVHFKRAHIHLVAYIKGLSDLSPQGEQLPPVVELTNIPPYHDFNMQTFGECIRYCDVSEYTTVEGKKMAMIEFFTPLFDEDTPMELIIKKQSDGTTLTTISLAEFLKENNIIIGNSVDLVLPILIEYIQGDVKINLPSWEQNPVSPEL